VVRGVVSLSDDTIARNRISRVNSSAQGSHSPRGVWRLTHEGGFVHATWRT
jgi:hypothetical protein